MHDGADSPDQIQVIDSHTAGEPTRVVIADGPSFGTGELAAQLAVFRVTAETTLLFDERDPFHEGITF